MSASLCERLVVVAIVLLPTGGAMAREHLPCERGTIALSISPDNNWVALVEEGVCASGAITVSTDTVRLARRDSTDHVSLSPRRAEPERKNDVLVVDYYGHAQSRPVLRWLLPNRLEITIPNISGVGLQKASYQGVEIVIKYEPNDPVAREKWWKERGLVPK